jgi:hypothetical protein
MNEMQHLVDEAYEMAKSGRWAQLLEDWKKSSALAKRCSRYHKPGSRWTFLHQAAYFGSEEACRLLISHGASTKSVTHDSKSADEIAESRGHHALAEFLRRATTGLDTLWDPSVDPDVLPSSNHWDEAKVATAQSDLYVSYAGGLVKIPKGSTYYVDDLMRILIGWHGTFDPPCGMGAESMLSMSSSVRN